MSTHTVAQSSWCPTAASIAAFHQQVEQVLTRQVEQLALPLPRFHFGDAYAAAMRDQQYRWENREVQHDHAVEQEEAAENERQWRDWCEQHQEELINMNGGVL